MKDFKILTSIKFSKILKDQSDKLNKEVNKKILSKEVKIIEKLFTLRLFKKIIKQSDSSMTTSNFVVI